MWTSDIPDFESFRSALRRSPESVFLAGVLDGRPVQLTAATLAEELQRFWVQSRDLTWRASVDVRGRRLVPVRVPIGTRRICPCTKGRGRIRGHRSCRCHSER